MTHRLIALARLITSAVAWPAQGGQSSGYLLLDSVVFSALLPVDMSAYAPDLRSLLQQHRRRFQAYRPRQRPPRVDPEREMGYDAREGYERRLVAVTTGADKLAQQYVDDLRPCYEPLWSCAPGNAVTPRCDSRPWGF